MESGLSPTCSKASSWGTCGPPVSQAEAPTLSSLGPENLTRAWHTVGAESAF